MVTTYRIWLAVLYALAARGIAGMATTPENAVPATIISWVLIVCCLGHCFLFLGGFIRWVAWGQRRPGSRR